MAYSTQSKMRVLVTRPEPGAAQTAARLIEQGFEPVVLPLSEIRSLHQTFPPADVFQAVVVTSANAIRHADSELIAALRHLPWHVVGATSAKAVRDSGISNVASVDADAKALGALIVAQFQPGAHILYLCGRVRSPDLEAELGRAGIIVSTVETYDTVDHEPSADQLRVLDAGPIDAVLVYSENMARRLADLKSMHSQAIFGSAKWIAISARAAAPLIDAGLEVKIAVRPNETDVFALLSETA